MRRGGGKFVEVAERCARAGALAVIIGNTEPELLATTAGDAWQAQARGVDVAVVVVCSLTMSQLLLQLRHGALFVSILPQVYCTSGPHPRCPPLAACEC